MDQASSANFSAVHLGINHYFYLLKKTGKQHYRKMETSAAISLTIVITLNIVLHSVACYLLWKTYNWTNLTTQQLLIFNLSICEWLVNLSWLVSEVLRLCGYKETSYDSYTFCIHTATCAVLYMLMVYMTLDRLMAVIFTFGYLRYWTVGRTKKILVFIWAIGTLLAVIFISLFEIFGNKWFYDRRLFFLSIGVFLFFLALAFITYAVIFWRYSKSRSSADANRTSNEPGQRFQRSRFHIPILIMLTYILFNIGPYIFYVVNLLEFNTMIVVTNVLFALGYMSDSLIYIFMQRNVRAQLISCCQCTSNTDEHSNTSNVTVVGIVAVSDF